ncbi:MAG TPA: AbrB/MazE/SpoVT family DNA-binding domain-containing protein [Candidatus Limnocylindrales bacterium]|nr:AbrB/MazE/SpoVT family DNA-binding domain-containing protein [Candidatus Limnocylindrales bacterium]
MTYIVKLNKKFQLTLPPEIREALKLQPDDIFILWLEGKTLILKRKDRPTSVEWIRKKSGYELSDQNPPTEETEETDNLANLRETPEEV